MTNVNVFVKGNHFFFTFLYAGLERLQSRGQFSINYIYPWNFGFRPSASNMVLSMQVTTRIGKRKNICFDMSDFNDHIYEDALEFHDLYFKRSYCATKYDNRNEILTKKIKPFGLIFACKYSYCFRAVFNLLAGFSPNKGEVVPLKTRIGQWYNYLKFPKLSDYENQNALPRIDTILFQTRAWNPSNYSNWQEINESRLKIIRALKAHYKDRFVGGFMPDHFSRQHYPDAITSFPSSRDAYVKLLKKSSICVYTHGLFDSTAFKLGEYLACGRCIVAQPIVNELLTPLSDGRHYLSFTTAEECVAKCEQLIQKRDLAKEMMKNNAEYYWEHVEPSKQMSNAFKMALAI